MTKLVVLNTWVHGLMNCPTSCRPEKHFRYMIPHMPPLYRPKLGSHPVPKAIILLTDRKVFSTKSISRGYLIYDTWMVSILTSFHYIILYQNQASLYGSAISNTRVPGLMKCTTSWRPGKCFRFSSPSLPPWCNFSIGFSDTR